MSYGDIAYYKTVSKEKYIEEKLKILSDFGVPATVDVVDKITMLYPREIAIENYIRFLIFQKLDT